VLLPIVSDQRPANSLFRRLDAQIAQRCQGHRVALTRQDGADDAHAGGASDVGDDVVQLQVHLHQRLLHVLDMGGRVVKQAFPLAKIIAQ